MHSPGVAIFRSGKFRFLYLLAMIQLVGGPIVLLQVTLFSKLVIREAPRLGVVGAVSVAFNSPEFRESLAEAGLPRGDAMKTTKKEGKQKPDSPTTPDFPWMAEPPGYPEHRTLCGVPEHFRIWTPQWPNAPPGPPPRIG